VSEISSSKAISSLADGQTLNRSLLLGQTDSGLVGLSNVLILLSAVEFDVTVAREVRADTTMGSVGSSTAGNSALDNNVRDDTGISVKLVGLSVGSEVDEELTNGVNRLLWPSTLGVLELFGLCVTSDTTSVPSEGDDLFLLEAVVHVLDGSVQLHSLGGTGDFVSVLVVSTQVGDSALSRFSGIGRLSTVLNHCKSLPIY